MISFFHYFDRRARQKSDLKPSTFASIESGRDVIRRAADCFYLNGLAQIGEPLYQIAQDGTEQQVRSTWRALELWRRNPNSLISA